MANRSLMRAHTSAPRGRLRCATVAPQWRPSERLPPLEHAGFRKPHAPPKKTGKGRADHGSRPHNLNDAAWRAVALPRPQLSFPVDRGSARVLGVRDGDADPRLVHPGRDRLGAAAYPLRVAAVPRP